jgi:hypothetical protein
MGRRRTVTMPFSLFAFQDIITSVTGVMVLVTLMLVLDFLDKVEGAPQHQSHQVIDEIRSTLSKVMLEVETLEATRQSHENVSDELAILDPKTLSSRFRSVSDVNSTLQKELQQALSLQQSAEESLKAWRVRSEDSVATSEEMTALQQRMQSRLQEIEKNQVKINRLKSSNRVLFSVPQRGGEKPWLVQVEPHQIRVAEMGPSVPPKIFETEAAFSSWLSARDPRNEYLVVLVTPESIDRYDLIANSLFERRFPYGVNLLRSGQSAIDAETGAAP